MTAQGDPRTIFRRAIERGNLVAAEIEARQPALIIGLPAIGPRREFGSDGIRARPSDVLSLSSPLG